MNDRDRWIIRNWDRMNSAQMGEHLGISRERVRQIAERLGLPARRSTPVAEPEECHLRQSWSRHVREGTICQRWADSWEDFREWMKAHGWTPGVVVTTRRRDRLLSPENCVIMTKQAFNATIGEARVHVTAWGETKTIAEWMDDPRCAEQSEVTLRARLGRMGMEPEEAISAERYSFYGIEE